VKEKIKIKAQIKLQILEEISDIIYVLKIDSEMAMLSVDYLG